MNRARGLNASKEKAENCERGGSAKGRFQYSQETSEEFNLKLEGLNFIYQALLNSIKDQFPVMFPIHFSHYIISMSADCFWAQI